MIESGARTATVLDKELSSTRGYRIHGHSHLIIAASNTVHAMKWLQI